MSRVALIVGVTGQDGAYLARLLLEKGYHVVGSSRRGSANRTARLAELGIANAVRIIDLDLLEQAEVSRQLDRVRPDEIYNLAGQSHVAEAFAQPVYTARVNAIGPAILLETIRTNVPEARYYQASTSEIFGRVPDAETIANEEHSFDPVNPYGISKLFAHRIATTYRESYGLFAVSGILFNHESPLRSRAYVTRKITHGLVQISNGSEGALVLGNLDARRDWGFAGDYVEGMWRMLQQDKPGDYVLASGRSESVHSFIELAAEYLGFHLDWERVGTNLRGFDRSSGRAIVMTDPALLRPIDLHAPAGDASKARKELGWSHRVSLEELVAMMVDADLRRAQEGTFRF